MRTAVYPALWGAPQPAILVRMAAILRRGGLVAFPTETVYGLGANALDERAVSGIFEAKGRPAHNPLIVHVPSIAAAQACAAQWPDHAAMLAARFWPGPLTLVLPKRDVIPSITTAGGTTVALRIPDHPLAIALLNACETPLAAPARIARTISRP
ncbi:MAG: L-threonylcarbamoyladenylate synthase [Pirellulales bacterium]